jgi:hypothetical protein
MKHLAGGFDPRPIETGSLPQYTRVISNFGGLVAFWWCPAEGLKRLSKDEKNGQGRAFQNEIATAYRYLHD